MRLRYDHTSGIALNCDGSNRHATLAADASFANLPFATVYLVARATAGPPATFLDKRSTFSPPNFVNRRVHLVNSGGNGFLSANLGRSSSLSTMTDADIFPFNTWMQVAVSWAYASMRLYKAPIGKPLKEVRYQTYSFGSGGSLDTEGTQPWTIGENTPTGSPSGPVQHFRYYNEFHEPGEVIRHQYEFGPARGQVINIDLGVRVGGTNVLDIVRGALAPITGATETAGVFVSEPDLAPEFIGAAGGSGNVGAGLINSIHHNRMQLVM